MERKLAAILAADVVGYSALMEADEAGTHERLKAGRKELFEPEIARHHGRVFKVMGDGMLAEFGSVVDAVECAVALQRGLAERNIAVPEYERIQVRIGINLGEVIVEGEDRYGEGVNIATRLEQLAEPGGIYVSSKVAKEVEKKLAFGFEPMGEQKVKNIAEPVSVFRIKLDGTPPRRLGPLPSQRAWPWAATIAALVLVVAGAWFASRPPAPEVVAPADPPVVADARPSLVVLPFANLSDDKEQGYLADGITEDLTTELARVPGLFVSSHNAASTYKDKAMQPAQIAKELGVRYILEGSVRRGGNDMRLNAQLIDAESGGHIWAERFDGQWADVFALQDKVVASIAGALKLRLVTGQNNEEIAGGTSNPIAYEAFLRGLELELRLTPADYAQAITLYEEALALDPNFGRAAAELAWVYWNIGDAEAFGLSWDEVDAKVLESLARAAEHPSPTYYQMAAQLLTREHNSDEAIADLQEAVALDPSDPWTFDAMSQALIFNGRPKEGRAYLDAAMRLDPAGLGGWAEWRLYLAGLAAFCEDRFEDAVLSLEKINPQSEQWSRFYGLQVRLSAYGHLGRSAELEAARAEFNNLLPEMDEAGYDRMRVQYWFVFKNGADIVRLLDGLSKAGIPELPPDIDPKSMDRLTSAEMQSLVFGHELRGHQTKPELAEYRRTTGIDGSTTVTIGAQTHQGKSWTQASALCTAHPKYLKELTTCGVIFRNPAGTREQSNEYQFVFNRSRVEFSIVK
jgi:TolB-like protein/class 3 adenylate cyclase